MADTLELNKPKAGTRINEVAKRLGVEPYKEGDIDHTQEVAYLMTGKDGEKYDIFKVLHAFLDCMEEVLQ